MVITTQTWIWLIAVKAKSDFGEEWAKPGLPCSSDRNVVYVLETDWVAMPCTRPAKLANSRRNHTKAKSRPLRTLYMWYMCHCCRIETTVLEALWGHAGWAIHCARDSREVNIWSQRLGFISTQLYIWTHLQRFLWGCNHAMQVRFLGHTRILFCHEGLKIAARSCSSRYQSWLQVTMPCSHRTCKAMSMKSMLREIVFSCTSPTQNLCVQTRKISLVFERRGQCLAIGSKKCSRKLCIKEHAASWDGQQEAEALPELPEQNGSESQPSALRQMPKLNGLSLFILKHLTCKWHRPTSSLNNTVPTFFH